MKHLKLKHLQLENWKAKNIAVDFNDSATSILARNELGKSSLMYAWHWLVTSQCNPWTLRNSDLFDNTKPITHDTPEAVVRAIVDIDGYEYTLERRAKAKFVRRGGSSEWTKAPSDEYKLFIDNIETSATEFNIWVDKIICPTMFLPFALSGDFFATIVEEDKQKARKILEALVGEINFEDFTSGKYDEIKDGLLRYPVEALREQAKKAIAPLRERLENLPSIIEREETLLSEFSVDDYDAILAEINRKKSRIAEIDDIMLGQSKDLEPFVTKRNAELEAITAKRTEYEAAHSRYNAELDKIRYSFQKELSDAKAKNVSVESFNRISLSTRTTKEKLLAAKRATLEVEEEARLKLIAQKNEIKERVFSEDKCASCGQTLPFEELEKARARFNANKEMSYDLIVTQGKACRATIESLKDEIAKIEEELSTDVELKEVIDTTAIENRIKDFDLARVEFEDTVEGSTMLKAIKTMIDSLTKIPSLYTDDLPNEKVRILSELDELNRKYGLKTKADDLRMDIEKHREEERSVAIEIAKWERRLMLIKDYIEERANITSDRINDKLDGCVIRMWSTQKDGSIVPDCIVVDDDGVKYSTCSNSKRIRMNIALQTLFRKHFEVSIPTFVDEASIFSSNNLPVGDAQTIYLYASDDETMKII